MFSSDPENQTVTTPKSQLNFKKREQNDSLQKELDSQKKKVLSKPSDINVTKRSWWNSGERSTNFAKDTQQQKSSSLASYKKSDINKVWMPTLEVMNMPKQVLVPAEFDNDVAYEENQKIKYYSEISKDKASGTFRSKSSYSYVTWAILAAALLGIVFFVYKKYS